MFAASVMRSARRAFSKSAARTALSDAVSALGRGEAFTAAHGLQQALVSLNAEAVKGEAVDTEECALRLAFGAVMQGQGRLSEANAEFVKVLEKQPKSVHALISLGHIAAMENRLLDARALLQEAFDRDPSSARARMALAAVTRRIASGDTPGGGQAPADAAAQAAADAEAWQLLSPQPTDAALPTSTQLRLEAMRAHVLQDAVDPGALAAAAAAARRRGLSVIDEKVGKTAKDACADTPLEPQEVATPPYGTPYGVFGLPDFPTVTLYSNQRGDGSQSKRSLDVVAPGPVPFVSAETDKVCYDVDAPEGGIVTEIMTLPATPIVGEQAVRLADARAPPGTDTLIPAGRLIPLRTQQWVSPLAGRPVQRGLPRELAPADAARLLQQAIHAVVLTGAGLSRAPPSNLRTRKELWMSLDRPERVGVWRTAPAAWVPLWELVEDFLASSGSPGLVPVPNAGHAALARLQRAGKLAACITQNTDHLHQAAGHAGPIIELHGTLERTVCASCGAQHGPARNFVGAGHPPFPPHCTACADGLLRPDVVLFGEHVPTLALQAAAEQAMLCDVMLVVGTAADVAPAADLPRLAARCGATVIEVKRTPSRLGDISHWQVSGRAEEVLPQIAHAVCRGLDGDKGTPHT
jgi:NAD-dependent deacetylase